MSKCFIFNSGRCVSCKACSAACTLENNWGIKARQIYSWNEDSLPGLPVFNYSLACNHCENPACMQACPAGCYSRDEATGAVLIDQEKCLGCKYCAWNCPYKAPRFNRDKRVIEKCDLCHTAVNNGEMPACVNACPTGALRFEELISGNAPEWFPVQKLKPAIRFSDDSNRKMRIVPEDKFGSVPQKKASVRWKSSDASLAVFTFLMTVLTSIVAASMLKGTFPGKYPVVILPLIAALASLFHLGRPLQAWRSLANFRSSALSREILFFIIFSVLSIGAAYLELPVLLISASVSGLMLLILIDNVYSHVCSSSWFHSGQTFLTALLLISYLSLSLIPFTFIVIVKIIMGTRMLIMKDEDNMSGIRFSRLAVLIFICGGWISGFYTPDMVSSVFIILIELVDRFLFYRDFAPENIKMLININLNRYINEEKRG